MTKRPTTPIIVSIIVTVVGLISLLFIHNQSKETQIDIEDPIISQVIDEETTDFKSIIHQAEKNVIQIESEGRSETFTGSGFLFNDKGDIMTNAHVIKNADTIYVRTANAHIYPAAVVGYSEEIDIAVLRVPQLAGQVYLPLEKELLAETGDEVIALGSPHGFQNTVTLGIISGTERNFSVDGYDYKNVYQISAQITHGNSGGPLINRNTGHVIGINSVGTEDGTFGFSIPIKEVIDQVELWSAKAINADLDFPNTADIIQFNPEQLEEDATYLIDYFFEGIQLRDYINAYTLLGSEMQAEMSYSNFRKQYIDTVELSYDGVSSEINEDRNAESAVNVLTEKKLPNEEETEEISHEYVFTVGYENDQLKILSITEN